MRAREFAEAALGHKSKDFMAGDMGKEIKEVKYKNPTGKPTHKRSRGRPIKLTEEIQEEIRKYIMQGSYVETAVMAAGVHKTTFYEWLKKANEDRSAGIDSIYVDFSNAVSRAIGIATQRDLNVIDKAAQDGDWRASAWKLERRAPHLWGPKSNVTIDDQRQEDVPGEKEVDAKFQVEFVEPKTLKPRGE